MKNDGKQNPFLKSVIIAMVLTGCSPEDSPFETAPPADFVRHAEIVTADGLDRTYLIGCEDGDGENCDLILSTLEDAYTTEVFPTPVIGHTARAWRFIKEEDRGTSVAFIADSSDPNNPGDYLLAGWWALYRGQHPPNLDNLDTEEFSLTASGPELNPAVPPSLPMTGTASYIGPAGGIYAFTPKLDVPPARRAFVFDAFEGVVTLKTDFETIQGCIGCKGDLMVRRAIAPVNQGNVQHDISDYEIILVDASIQGGKFRGDARIGHPTLDVMNLGDSSKWRGQFSSIPDATGIPRLVTGDVLVEYKHEDQPDYGYFYAVYLGVPDPESTP